MGDREQRNEDARLRELYSFNILDTLAEKEYDELTELAASICDTSMSLISLLDTNRQWFKSSVGLEIAETPREYAFCEYAIKSTEEVLEIEDAKKDKRVSDNPLVLSDPNIRFYAGAPLVTSNGLAIGTLCVLDKEPKKLTAKQKSSLKYLSNQAMRLLEIKKLAHRYEAFFETTSDLIYELDMTGRYVYANKSVEALFGLSLEQLRKKAFWDFVPIKEQKKTTEDFHNQIATQVKSGYAEFPVYTAEGTTKWLAHNVDFNRKNKSRSLRVYAIAKDITTKKQAIKEQDNLVSVIAHDLKAPFNQIFGFTEILKHELQGEQAEIVSMIGRISAASRKMIENLVYLRYYESAGFTPTIAMIDIDTIYQTKMAGFSALAEQKSILLKGKLKKIDAPFWSDVNAIDRIISNLLSNAIKFSPDHTTIQFGFKGTRKKLTISVADEGPGFTKEDQKKAFRKFQKLSARPTGGESSSGLGLSIIKELVQGLGGSIKLESEKGKGALFLVELPNKKA
ncbi:MAG: ATP-binding protein [Bacteroidota bacterium]